MLWRWEQIELLSLQILMNARTLVSVVKSVSTWKGATNVNVAVAIRWILLLECARQWVSIGIKLLSPLQNKVASDATSCYCGFDSSCAVTNTICTDLDTPSTLNDAMIQYLKLPDKLLVSSPWAGGHSPIKLWREKRMRCGTAKTSVSIH